MDETASFRGATDEVPIPRDSSEERVLWRVQKGPDTAQAVLRRRPTPELQLVSNGEPALRFVDSDRTHLVNASEDLHSQLLGRGWSESPPDAVHPNRPFSDQLPRADASCDSPARADAIVPDLHRSS